MRITLANQKGGVGKTTSAVHIAAGLALAGHQPVLFDLDPQRSSTLCLTPDGKTKQYNPNKSGGLEGWNSIETNEGVVVFHPGPGVGPGDLPRALAAIPGNAPTVLDCPPNLEGWTPAAVAAADHTIVPLQCEFLSLQGLARMIRLVEGLALRPRTFHVLPVMYERERRLHHEVVEEVAEHFRDALCHTRIPRDPLFPEAASHGCSLFRFRPRSSGCTAYASLIREIADEWT